MCPGDLDNMFIKLPFCYVVLVFLAKNEGAFTTPTTCLRSENDIFEGVVYEFSEPKRAAKHKPGPRIASAMFSVGFVGVCLIFVDSCGSTLALLILEACGLPAMLHEKTFFCRQRLCCGKPFSAVCSGRLRIMNDSLSSDGGHPKLHIQ